MLWLKLMYVSKRGPSCVCVTTHVCENLHLTCKYSTPNFRLVDNNFADISGTFIHCFRFNELLLWGLNVHFFVVEWFYRYIIGFISHLKMINNCGSSLKYKKKSQCNSVRLLRLHCKSDMAISRSLTQTPRRLTWQRTPAGHHGD